MLIWMRIYNGLLAGTYALVLVMGVVFALFHQQIGSTPDTSPEEALFMGLFYGAIGGVLCPLYAVGVWLPRKRWAWIYAIVLLALSMTSCCCLVLAIPLLIYWVKPETKAYFEV